MFLTLLSIALGGATGALARFGISKLPFLNGYAFPWPTLAANLFGALIIGFIAGAMQTSHKLTPNQSALLKTGFCGALTTFSTFSLEAVTLFDNGKYMIAMIYIILSVIFSIIGVLAGRTLAVHCLS